MDFNIENEANSRSTRRKDRKTTEEGMTRVFSFPTVNCLCVKTILLLFKIFVW